MMIHGKIWKIMGKIMEAFHMFHGKIIYINIYCWLVVPTPLKNISQLGVLFPIYGKIMKNKSHVPNHQHLLGILGNLTAKFQNVASLLRSGPFFTGSSHWFIKILGDSARFEGHGPAHAECGVYVC